MKSLSCSWADLGRRITDQGNRLRVIDEFIGYQHRPEGWHSDDRYHGNHMHVAVLVEHGSVIVHDRFTAGPGQAVLMNAGPHGPVTFEPGVRFHEVWIGCFAGVRPFRAEPDQVLVDGAGDTRWLFSRLADELLHRGHPDRQVIRTGVAMLLACLTRPGPASKRGPGLSRFQREELLLWTRDHLHDHPEPADLAALLELTPDYFARIFRNTFGQSPRAWLVEERVRAAARELRESGDPIHHIATAYGFGDPSHFGRIFRKIIGSSPRQWRRAD